MPTNAPSSALTNAVSSVPEELHDIVGPVRIVSIQEWIGIGAAILAVLALLAAAWWWWRRRQWRLAQPPPPAPPLPPHTRAWRDLEAALRLIGDPNAFCTAVSAIVRAYLEERFGWNAPDRTTEEFLADLQRRDDFPDWIRTLLGDFLTRCDLVKFARLEPTESELRALHQSAVRLVNDTVPPPPPPDGAPVPPSTPSPAATRT